MHPTVTAIAEELTVAACPADTRPGMLVPVLRELQTRLGTIPTALVPDIAKVVGVAESRVFSVASFYPAFRVTGQDIHPAAPLAESWLEYLVGVSLRQMPLVCCRTPQHPIEDRRVISRCRCIDPWKIDDYVRDGGYEGLGRAREMTPAAIIEAVAASGLRGRGGAAFPTASKWRYARQAEEAQKFIICNAAEGDLGATMDSAILRTDPHAVLEGMAIAALAIGASKGLLFLRAEYGSLLPLLREAIRQAESLGFLGSGFAVEVIHAAGRYVCGEETALLNAMEGKPGRPRFRPPFPAETGLWGKPTVINNVKTLAAVPLILRHGPEWFASVGTERSRGTAILALTGHVVEPGLSEVPMGAPLRRVIEDVGGGVSGDRSLKAVQTGGPLGGLIPRHLLDTPITYEDMAAAGSPLGSGGMIVLAEGTCMVAIARCFTRFCAEESCGYCAPCRLGASRVDKIVADIMRGRATHNDLTALGDAALAMRHASFCAFGQAAPGVVSSAVEHFGDEFEEHIRSGKCPTGACDVIVRAEDGEGGDGYTHD